MLAWLPLARAVRRHTVPDAPPDDVSHALPWGSLTAWLLALYLACQSWQFYSSLAWLAPTYESAGWTARSAGLLMAAFTGAQLVSGLVAPTLLDHVGDPRVLLVTATLLGGTGEVGVWLASAGPAVGVGAAARRGAGRLLRARPRAARAVRRPAPRQRPAHRDGVLRQLHHRRRSGRRTMGAVEDVTGSFAVLWALLALVAVPQLAFALRLRPGLPRVGAEVAAPEPVRP